MQYYPTQEAALAYQDEDGYLPLTLEILCDQHTPITLLSRLKTETSHCFLLESVDSRQRWGRYSFLGYDPLLALSTQDHLTTVQHRDGSIATSEEHPEKVIRRVLKEYKSLPIDKLPPFTGGLVGYFSYDYIKYQESHLLLDYTEDEAFKDLDLMFFDQVICFDHYRQVLTLIVTYRASEGSQGYTKAQRRLLAMLKIVQSEAPLTHFTGVLKEPLRPLFSKNTYCTMVDKAKHYIREGDIFQVVLSNRWEAAFEGSLMDTYRALRTINPSPYMFYFSGNEIELAGASPETLVNLQDGILHTFPLAGTRRRGETEEEDLANERDLLSDEKELAEHNMLVDLGRNDLGKVCEFGSVEVESYLQIQRYSHVMHIGSTVKGTIRKDHDALSAIASVLPAGTLSGAPKLRACQIIEELEHTQRGIYGGAVGYIGSNQNMDTCIAIRLAYRKGNTVYVRSGAGIVADSVAESEYAECERKAKAVEEALQRASGGIL
ncbi:MAG: anthranilate synthase component [Sphaerochaeta sp.]|jgi:anthranilate synthase component 1|uniref:Anthranilate synthase component 1 n=1 Tax=Sphaerochaeta halotolerans TaxID=2293840 RepID=A0A372MHM9_9SPIR|nr:anthranilate synthase component I family protein [Sphaerochaeta halotolerans]MDK2859487.1 anthranilate synthase component [Sphaerochaeta sp.]MDN5333502.1 anthranilate synthase component [Sphaerochaeta sp.]RFU94963.1 anthranilate synthase component I family protein [Sphaerochaeta halotolerans]